MRKSRADNKRRPILAIYPNIYVHKIGYAVNRMHKQHMQNERYGASCITNIHVCIYINTYLSGSISKETRGNSFLYTWDISSTWNNIQLMSINIYTIKSITIIIYLHVHILKHADHYLSIIPSICFLTSCALLSVLACIKFSKHQALENLLFFHAL